MDFKSLVSALPSAATSPFAFVAYVLVIASWVVIALRLKRNRQLLDHIEKLPQADRLKALQLEMGAVQVRSGLTADQWLRSRVHLYYFLGFCVGCVAAVVVFAIAVTTPATRADASGPQTSTPATRADASGPQPSALAATAVSGDWHAAFTDPDEAPGGNQFFFHFKPIGAKLFGTAIRVYSATNDQSHGLAYGISDGKIEGNTISFWFIGGTIHDNGDGHYTPVKDLFTGTVTGDTIHFIYQVGESPPVEFVIQLCKSLSDSEFKTASKN